MIPQETIDRIFEVARIEEVVGDFVQLKKAGVNYKGRCPFHDEKTPSFVVSPTKGIYKCFGCGKGGNSIMFIQEIQAASYPEALKHIAGKYNIEILEKELTSQEKLKISAKESQFIATKFACEYFQNTLWNSDEGKIVGLSYFKERGFSEDTIKKFNLGYSPKKQNSFEKQALKSGYDKKILIESSLIGENENGKSYDKFRERAIFPIQSYSGRVVGFGGRAFNSDAKSKYLNSSETLIYDKSKVLYGINIAKTAITKANNCFIVEGYTDVIAMHQNGVENVVSASGTALGPFQISLIKRLSNNVVLLFDGDTAGTKATIRSINLCLAQEMNVKIASFPEGEDPDSYSKKLTSKEFKEYLENQAVTFVDYLISIYNLKNETDPGKIIEIKKSIILSISKMPDVFSREEYCKIYSSKLGVSEKSLLNQVVKARSMTKPVQELSFKKGGAKRDGEKTKTSNNLKLEQYEYEVLRILINYGNNTFYINGEEETVAAMIINELYQDSIVFSSYLHQKLYSEIVNMIANSKLINPQKLINSPDNDISIQAVNLVAKAHSISKNWRQKHNIITGREDKNIQKTTEKALLSLKKEIVSIQISELQKELTSEKITQEKIKKLSALTKLKTQISKVLGRNIG